VKKTIEMVITNLPLPEDELMIRFENLIIYADPRLEKFFYNLIENALRHGNGVSRITISSLIQEDKINIVCQDNGKGIPEHYKKRSSIASILKIPVSGSSCRGRFWVTGLSIHEPEKPEKEGDAR
jgi:light-regulated signal transduction histidine kinase (bacteriophytochrome)